MPKDIDDKKQQLENNRTREAAADKAKPRCSICGKYTDKKTSPQCFGHGGGGGGSSGGESGDKAGKDDATILSKSPSQVDTGNKAETSAIGSNVALTSQLELNDIKFNPEVISELLSKKLLVIDNDREKGILTIKLQCDPNSLSPEQRNELKKFVNAVLNELNEFKKEKGLSADCYKIEKDKDGNILSLRIALPTPTLYDSFIQRLASKNLLPVQNIEQIKNEKNVYPEGANHFNPTPLSTKLTPENKKPIEDESQKAEKSSIHPKSPFDGLKGPKPKGWKK